MRPTLAALTTTAVPDATATAVTPAVTSTSSPTATPTSVAYDRNARAILVEADLQAATPLVPYDAHVPTFRLYADGLVVAAGQAAPLTTGLDASVRTGQLSEPEIQDLLAYLRGVGFFDWNAYYAPRPTPLDLPTAHIRVFLDKVKTVTVYGPGQRGTPQSFQDAFTRIIQLVPADSKPFAPDEGYLSAVSAGPANDLRNAVELAEWSPSLAIRLADAVEGLTISGTTYASIAELVGKAYPRTLFREGGNAYRVRLAPNLPRAPHLTDWLGPILEAPREFEGRVFDLVGYFRGWNLYGEARGNPPRTRSDWVIADSSGAMWVTGALPAGLDASSRSDVWTVIRLRAAVVYVRNGTSHLEARRVDTIVTNPLAVISPTPTSSASATSSVVLPGASAAAGPAATLAVMATPKPTAVFTFAATAEALAGSNAAPTAAGTGTVPPSSVPKPSPASTAAPTTSSLASAGAAIAAVKARFTEMTKINAAAPGAIGASTDIKAFERSDGWDLVFWEGWGDCPAGCINNRYTYFSVKKVGGIQKVGEYSRIFNSTSNSFDTTGAPLWGVPK